MVDNYAKRKSGKLSLKKAGNNGKKEGELNRHPQSTARADAVIRLS